MHRAEANDDVSYDVLLLTWKEDNLLFPPSWMCLQQEEEEVVLPLSHLRQLLLQLWARQLSAGAVQAVEPLEWG